MLSLEQVIVNKNMLTQLITNYCELLLSAVSETGTVYAKDLESLADCQLMWIACIGKPNDEITTMWNNFNAMYEADKQMLAELDESMRLDDKLYWDR